MIIIRRNIGQPNSGKNARRNISCYSHEYETIVTDNELSITSLSAMIHHVVPTHDVVICPDGLTENAPPGRRERSTFYQSGPDVVDKLVDGWHLIVHAGSDLVMVSNTWATCRCSSNGKAISLQS